MSNSHTNECLSHAPQPSQLETISDQYNDSGEPTPVDVHCTIPSVDHFIQSYTKVNAEECSLTSAENSCGDAREHETPAKFEWIDESKEICVNSSSSHSSLAYSETYLTGVEDVRKRLQKRRRRKGTKNMAPQSEESSKRLKNTIAARRYRERRQKEVEILDGKVEELESKLLEARLEAKWWKMEAQRWREFAEKGENK